MPSRNDVQNLSVAVLGAGPVGLAAAAHLLDRGVPFFVLEGASGVGTSLRDYGHVRLFSPWRYNIDPVIRERLLTTGWRAPLDAELPLAREVVERVLQPFSVLPEVAPHLRLNTRVVAITRDGIDKVKTAGRADASFVIRTMQDDTVVEYRARAVIDATGTWFKPNPLGSNGLEALGEREARSSISYGVPDVLGADRARFAGKRTLVVGAGHSAANTLLDLATLSRGSVGTSLIWAVRSPTLARVFGGGDADALPARGRLGSSLRELRDSGELQFFEGLRIKSIERHEDRLTVSGSNAEGAAMTLTDIDQIVCATGQRPDLSLTSELRLRLDPWLESTEALGPLIDPNVHSCGTVRPHGHRELAHPDAGFYTIGVKSYGRAPTFLMATGFEQARSVVAAIAGDLEAADRVELDLPVTGVCGIGPTTPASKASSACCGTDTPVATDTPSTASKSCRQEAGACGTAIVREQQAVSGCC